MRMADMKPEAASHVSFVVVKLKIPGNLADCHLSPQKRGMDSNAKTFYNPKMNGMKQVMEMPGFNLEGKTDRIFIRQT
jgi:hypothetical protein